MLAAYVLTVGGKWGRVSTEKMEILLTGTIVPSPVLIFAGRESPAIMRDEHLCKIQHNHPLEARRAWVLNLARAAVSK
jgi:hypothetical protein